MSALPMGPGRGEKSTSTSDWILYSCAGIVYFRLGRIFRKSLQVREEEWVARPGVLFVRVVTETTFWDHARKQEGPIVPTPAKARRSRRVGPAETPSAIPWRAGTDFDLGNCDVPFIEKSENLFMVLRRRFGNTLQRLVDG